MNWSLSFITENEFYNHVRNTIEQYGQSFEPYNLLRFNENIVDPVKLIFDKTIYGVTWDEIINKEILRQRDKSNNNSIGYFHQKIFKYFKSCTVPNEGWDVIYKDGSGISIPDGEKVQTVYVEMKNKFNTMNSSSSSKTYAKMQEQLLADDKCACFLVEVIAQHSQNVAWRLSINGMRRSHRLIRRVSIDEFYSLVTGQNDAFYQMCMVLPEIISNVIENASSALLKDDVVINELQETVLENGGSYPLALYMLGFKEYRGFNRFTAQYGR